MCGDKGQNRGYVSEGTGRGYKGGLWSAGNVPDIDLVDRYIHMQTFIES